MAFSAYGGLGSRVKGVVVMRISGALEASVRLCFLGGFRVPGCPGLGA